MPSQIAIDRLKSATQSFRTTSRATMRYEGSCERAATAAKSTAIAASRELKLPGRHRRLNRIRDSIRVQPAGPYKCTVTRLQSRAIESALHGTLSGKETTRTPGSEMCSDFGPLSPPNSNSGLVRAQDPRQERTALAKIVQRTIEADEVRLEVRARSLQSGTTCQFERFRPSKTERFSTQRAEALRAVLQLTGVQENSFTLKTSTISVDPKSPPR